MVCITGLDQKKNKTLRPRETPPSARGGEVCQRLFPCRQAARSGQSPNRRRGTCKEAQGRDLTVCKHCAFRPRTIHPHRGVNSLSHATFLEKRSFSATSSLERTSSSYLSFLYLIIDPRGLSDLGKPQLNLFIYYLLPTHTH